MYHLFFKILLLILLIFAFVMALVSIHSPNFPDGLIFSCMDALSTQSLFMIPLGILYDNAVERYFRECGEHGFFLARRKSVVLLLIANIGVLPILLGIIYYYLFLLVGFWDGFFIAPLVVSFSIGFSCDYDDRLITPKNSL